MSTKVLLKYLDSPVRILSFTITDIVGYLSPFFFGAIFDSLLIIPMCSLIAMYFVKKALRRFPRFFLLRSLYWHLPTKQFNKSVKILWPSSSKRLWVK